MYLICNQYFQLCSFLPPVRNATNLKTLNIVIQGGQITQNCEEKVQNLLNIFS